MTAVRNRKQRSATAATQTQTISTNREKHKDGKKTTENTANDWRCSCGRGILMVLLNIVLFIQLFSELNQRNPCIHPHSAV